MKKIIFSIVLCGITTVAMAQFKFGVNAGMNFSFLTSNINENNGEFGDFGFHNVFRGGLLCGAYAGYDFNEMWGAQIEGALSFQGNSYWLLPYINVPVLAKFRPISSVPLSILAGPQFGYLIDDVVDYQGKQLLFKKFDFSVALGVQYMFIEHLTFGMRYNFGITPNYDSTKSEGMNPAKGSRNMVFQLTVGWTF